MSLGLIERGEFRIRRGDLLPRLELQLLNSDGQPPDDPIPDGTVVLVEMLHRRTLVLTQLTGVVDDATTWEVGYDWQAGDTDQAGLYDSHITLIFAGGIPWSFPNDHEFVIQVYG